MSTAKNAGRSIDRNVPWVLAFAFSLTMLLILGSAYIAIGAMERIGARRADQERQYRISTRLIDEIQDEEAGLSHIFYSLARAPGPDERRVMLDKLDAIGQKVKPALEAGLQGPERARWLRVRAAAVEFSGAIRRALTAGPAAAGPSPDLLARHQDLMSELTDLVAANFRNAVDAQALEDQRSREQLGNSLGLLGVAVLLSIFCAAATVRFATRVFGRMRWQASELSRLSRHVFETQETTLRRISRELHDEFGQTLSAIEANLAAIPVRAPEVALRIEDCVLLVKDAMANVRELSQLLRPSILDDFGLTASLQWLGDSFTERNGIAVEVRLAECPRLPTETETGLFRIAQEALTNVARHSGASAVEITLQRGANSIVLSIADNGRGLGPRGGATGGFGLAGIRERVKSARGELNLQSSSRGVTISVEVPIDTTSEREEDPSLVGG